MFRQEDRLVSLGIKVASLFIKNKVRDVGYPCFTPGFLTVDSIKPEQHSNSLLSSLTLNAAHFPSSESTPDVGILTEIER